MKIVILEDHPLMRSALMAEIEQLVPNAQIEAFARLQATKRWLQSNPDCQLVLMDLTLPDGDESTTLSLLRAEAPRARMVVVSAQTDPHAMRAAFSAGAFGYIPKNAGVHILKQALSQVISGRSYMPPELQSLNRAILAAPVRRPAIAVAEPAAGDASADSSAANSATAALPLAQRLGLTERQRDVLNLILRGLPNKLICRHLSLAEGTVKVHVSAVLRIMGVRNRTEAVVAAARMGWNGE